MKTINTPEADALLAEVKKYEGWANAIIYEAPAPGEPGVAIVHDGEARAFDVPLSVLAVDIANGSAPAIAAQGVKWAMENTGVGTPLLVPPGADPRGETIAVPVDDDGEPVDTRTDVEEDPLIENGRVQTATTASEEAAYIAGVEAGKAGDPRQPPDDEDNPGYWIKGYDHGQLLRDDDATAGLTDVVRGIVQTEPDGPIRSDSGLTPDEHLSKHGTTDDLPADHPDHAANRAAYQAGWGEADSGKPRWIPARYSDYEAQFFLRGYDDRMSHRDPSTADGAAPGARNAVLADLEEISARHMDRASMSTAAKSGIVCHVIGKLIELTAGDAAFDSTKNYLLEARNVCPRK